ncbi:hypothetical protein K449DRAFT_439162 [Hypoxylon sp. EC38]|nr:hypothetical protein K449DRAFT_439162 [Hypoxylon sp. EC38]
MCWAFTRIPNNSDANWGLNTRVHDLICVAVLDPETLGLTEMPLKLVVSEKSVYVLIHGVGTAFGLLAVQLLK